VLVVTLSLLALGGLFIWMRTGPRALPQSRPDGTRQQIAQVRTFRTDEPLRIVVYCPSGGMLAAESAAVRRQPDTQSQAREAASALLASPCVVQARVLSALRLNALYLNSSGAAYVDLSAAASGQDGTGSAWDEILAVYAIVNTLTQNFEDIKRVHILVNGKETQTLAGHIDISVPFTKRMELVKQ